MSNTNLHFARAASFFMCLHGRLVPPGIVSCGSNFLSRHRGTGLRAGVEGRPRVGSPRVPGWFNLVLLLLALPGALLAQPTPPPVISNVALQGGNFRFSFPTEECQTYVVMSAANLTSPVAWTPLAQLAGNGSVITFMDTGATQPSRYYCVGIGGMIASVNTVGYVRRLLQPGTNLVANPLYSSSGNSIGSLFPNCPEGSQILVPVPDGSLAPGSVFSGGAWNPPNLNLFPGQGLGIVNPSAPFEVAFVGEVPQGMFPFGGLTNPLPVGLSLKSSIAPVNGLLNFPAQEGDMILTWNATNQTGVWHEYFGGNWWDPLPVIRPGEAFWVFVSQPENWVQSFEAHSVGSGGSGPPVIANQPQSRTNMVGSAARFSVAATGAPLAYQWYFNTNTPLPGETSCTLTLSNVQTSNAGAYAVVITNSLGSITSAVATLTVISSDNDGDGMPNDWELANGLDPDDPADAQLDPDGDGMTNLEEYLVGTNPHDASSRFALSVIRSGGNITLQWATPGATLQSASSAESGVWQNVTGAASPYTTVASGPQRLYRLVYFGASSTVYSANIVGYINLPISPGPNYISNPLSNGVNSIGLLIPNPPDGTWVIKQGVENWYSTGFGWDYPNMTLTPGEEFEIWNQSGSSFLNTFVGEVTSAPVIGLAPSSTNVGPGTQVDLFVVASGTPALGFQWRFNGTNLLLNTNSILALSNLQLPNSGNYDVVVTNAYGSTTSRVAVVKVITPPLIESQPQPQTVDSGSNVTFAVAASGTEPLSYQWFFNQTNLIAGATNATLSLPAVSAANAGSYHVLVSNEWGSTNSAAVVLTIIAPDPCLNVAVDSAGHAMGTLLALHVQSFDCTTSNAIPDISAVVWISTAGTTRSVPVTTDGAGQATVYFQPLAGEAGNYEISAGLTNQPSPPAQGSFSIVGIGFDTNQVAHRLIIGVSQTNHIELRNLTDVPLSGLGATLLGVPANVTIQIDAPATLPGNATNTLTYVLQTSGPTPTQSQCLLRIISIEGATNDVPVTLTIVPPVPQLVATPSSIQAAMLRGAQSVATFQVANVGGASSGDLEILLPGGPSAGWLGLVSPPVIPALAPNAQAEITVSLAPSNNLPLGPYTGGVALWSSEAGQTDVPFQFDCVSALKGNLRVTVVDEFTYYAAGAPKVTNATVTLLDPYVRTNITSAVTDADGVALFTNLTEAYYEVQVAASQHGSFGTVVLVPGNQTFNLIAFLARQMVSYRWIVTTQAITDRYVFTLDTRFETEVPAPVLRVVPGAINLCDYEDNAEGNWVVNLTIFNSGLITAKAARVFFGNHPRFAIAPLADYLGDIPGGSSLVVPVIIRRLADTNEGPSQIEAHLDWQLPTGETTRYYRVPIYVYNAGLHDCDPANPGSVPTSPPILWSAPPPSLRPPPVGDGVPVVPILGTSPSRPHITYPPAFPPPSDPPVPVQVGVQLSQSAVMIRQAFEAFLAITNGSSGSLSSLEVVIDIRDSNGQSVNDRFGIRPPDLLGLNAVDGSGTLAAFGSGSARWTIIPATNAAPTGPTHYTVGGSLTFQQNGAVVQIPLFNVPITVFPDARLVVDYFWERVVYSDDPFTPEVEPAAPFGVGLRMKNIGLGKAMAVQITSAQPQIVDNASGLLVGFRLVGSQVGSQTLRPSLTATLGDIDSGSNAVAAWWMTASLQGRFTNYSASFAHLDDLGQGNLSLVDSVAIHPLVHVVRADVPADDLVPDFLVSDGYLTNTLPDGLYSSDGSVASVTAVTNGNHNGPPSPVHTNVLLTASVLPGWVYLRIPDPGPGVPLTYVKRSDGRFLLLDYNVWTTHRIIHPLNGDPPYREDFLHLLDFDSTGSYTLGYSVALYISQPPQSRTNVVGTTATFSVGVGGTQPFAYQWLKFGTNLVGQTNATLTITNVQVGDAGLYSVIVSNVAGALPSTEARLTVWVPPVITTQPQNQTNTVGSSASFTVAVSGTTPFAYQWFKNGTSLLVGQTNATLVISSIQTNDAGSYSVQVNSVAGNTNSLEAMLKVLVPPWICPVSTQYLIVGRPLVITNCAVDEDEPITFSLGVNPAGVSITTNGILRWTPSCAQGSSTNLITVRATDSGIPPSSNSMTFTAIVTECIEASLGNTVMLAGTTSSVPVRLLSTVALTNMAFTVAYPPERFTTNFTLTANSPQILTQWLELLADGQVTVSFTLPTNSVLYGPTNVGLLGFTTVSNQSSAFVPLPIIDLTGLKPDGGLVGNAFGLPGRVVVVGSEPLLEAWRSGQTNIMLTLYGNPGVSYQVLENSDLPSTNWVPRWLIPMTNTWESWELNATAPRLFYRAK